MTTRTNPWAPRVRRAMTSTGNLLAGAGALALAALTWNPLPMILFGLGQPVWLYRAAGSSRHDAALDADARRQARDRRRARGAWLEQQLDVLVARSPCGAWLRRGLLPDYPRSYRRLVELRDHTERLIEDRRDLASTLEHGLIDGLDGLLAAYLTMARERLLFHCSLAEVYPTLPSPPDDLEDGDARGWPAPSELAPRGRTAVDVPMVPVTAALASARARAERLTERLEAAPDQADVYRPLLATLEERLAELEDRGRRDQAMAAQLEVLPDQFELVHSKLATAGAEVGGLVLGMQLLLEQTDDTVRFTAELRRSSRA